MLLLFNDGIKGRNMQKIALSFSWIFWCCTLLFADEKATEQVSEKRPNILFFLVDDMGWQDTSVPFYKEKTKLNAQFRTPNMQKLADQGRMFTQAYACTICSPTRVSLMTGMNAARHRVTSWTKKLDSETSKSSKRLKAPNWNLNGMGPLKEKHSRVYKTDTTLPRLLQQAGYRTIHAGKAHFAAQSLLGANPINIGFDVNIAGNHLGGPGSYLSSKHFGKGSWHIFGLDAFYPENNGTGEDIFLTEALTQEMNKSISKAVADGVPFFAYMAHYAVHVPLAEDTRFSKNYPSLNPTERKYATMIEGMDKSLGDILAKLNELGVAENTLVIFYSDNGGLSFTGRGKSPYGGRNTHNWPLRAGKGSAYEGGIRVPFIAAWAKPNPKNPLQKAYPIPKNSTCKKPVIIEDMMPTVLKIAGINPPENLDGFDISGYLHADPTFSRPNNLFLFNCPNIWSEVALRQNQGYEPFTALREGDWKIIYLFHNKRWELYHLSSDIHEEKNLVKTHPEKFKSMRANLIRLMKERGGQYPILKETGKEADLPL